MDGARQSDEIFLQPGEFHFGADVSRLRTTLGSCVAITMWHPRLRLGGMCHYMLPTRIRPGASGLDGRYGDEAMELFLSEIRDAGTHPREYQVKVFGGASMFSLTGPVGDVGARNIARGKELLRAHGFCIAEEQLAGNRHRNVMFDVWSGAVWVGQGAAGSGYVGHR